MKKTLSYIYAVLAFGALTAFDQFTKYLARTKLADGKTFSLIKNALQFNYVRNEGAAWGIMSGKQTFFIILTILMLVLLLVIYIRIPYDGKYIALRITMVTLAAGALGNLIDRMSKGYVDDFIDFYLINFPVFNFADICVCLSMISLVILIAFIYKDNDFNFLKFKSKESEKKDEQ